jgi:hypothetical protein
MKRDMARPIVISLFLSVGFPSVVTATSGNDWEKFSDSFQTAYIGGVVDTWWMFQETMDSSPKVRLYTGLSDCIKERHMTYGQIAAVVKKYMDEHPQDWGYSMSALIWQALDKVCRPSGQ